MMKRVVFFILSICLAIQFNTVPTTAMIASSSTIHSSATKVVSTVTRSTADTNLVQTTGYDVDFTKSSEGIIRVLFNTGSTQKIKLVVKKDATQYIYNLSNLSTYVNFPLQMGAGDYTVKLYENTTGTKYRELFSTTQTVNLSSTNSVYLQSIQEISWSKDDDAIKMAAKIVADLKASKTTKSKTATTLTEKEIIDAYYKYVISNISYDYDKIKTIAYNYVPDIDAILTAKKGICYDYSAVLASMLRSAGIPTKMIKGYSTTTDVYHAWNEIYLSSEKRWMIVDATFDAYYYKLNKSYTMEKSAKDYEKQKEY